MLAGGSGRVALRVFLRKGGTPRTSILWDLDFLRSITAIGKGHESYSCSKSSAKIPRFSVRGTPLILSWLRRSKAQ